MNYKVIFSTIFLLVSTSFCSLSSFAQSPADSFYEGFFQALFNRDKDTTDAPKKRKELVDKALPYRIAPAHRKAYNQCLKKQKSICALDTFSHTGLSITTLFTGFMPLGKYAELAPGATFGFNAGFDYQPSSKFPMTIGFNSITMFPGVNHTKATIPFTIFEGNSDPSLFDIPINIRIRNSMLNLHGTLKFWIPTKYVQPYFQIGAGMMYASTNVKFIVPENGNILSWNENDEIFRKSLLNKVTWSTAATAGLGINVAYFLDVDLRATYLHSGAINYYTEEQIKTWKFEYGRNSNLEDLNSVPPDYQKSPIQNLSFSIGFHLFFV